MYVLLMSLVLLSTLRFLIKLIDFFLPPCEAVDRENRCPQNDERHDLRWREKPVTQEPIVWGSGGISNRSFRRINPSQKELKCKEVHYMDKADILQGPRTRQEAVMDTARLMEQPDPKPIFHGS